MTDNTEYADQGTPGRDFRLPDLAAAAAQFQASQSRALQGPVGCLFLLAGVALVITFLFILDARDGAVFSVGLAVLVAGIVLLRAGTGVLAAWIAALGLGASIAAALSLMGTTAPWIYWTVAGLLAFGGFAIAGSGSGATAGFLRVRPRKGCRIGFFRPFRAEYSAEAKNLLFPLLSGYGSVFFVGDETFDEADFDGLWSKDYKALPGLVGGHRYTNEEWQRQVVAQLPTVDVAIVDVSVPSSNVIWEIKQCYDWLPSHRIVLVASAAALPRDVVLDVQDASLKETIGEFMTPILKGLTVLDANPTTQPLMLVYAQGVEGQVWLANALYHAMSNIVAIEAGSMSQR
jgi:hypothetical protein